MIKIQGLPLSSVVSASDAAVLKASGDVQTNRVVSDQFVLAQGSPVPRDLPPVNGVFRPHAFQNTLAQDVYELVTELQNPRFSETTREIDVRHVKTKRDVYTVDESRRLNKFLKELSLWRDRIHETLYAKNEPLPDKWIYPAAGYDLATMLWMQDPEALRQRSHVFVMVQDASPSTHFLDSQMIESSHPVEYHTENIYDNMKPNWGADAVINKDDVVNLNRQNKGMLVMLLGRLKAYFGDEVNIRQVVAFRDKSWVPAWAQRVQMKHEPEYKAHGLIVFDFGDGTPCHYCFYINGRLRDHHGRIPDGDTLADHMLSLGEMRDLSLSLQVFSKINGIFVRGSMGCLSPRARLYTSGFSRDYLLSVLAHHQGLVLEGMFQDPQAQYRDLEPVLEVTSEIPHGRYKGTERVIYNAGGKDCFVVPLDVSETSGFNWSYFPGARASRFFES